MPKKTELRIFLSSPNDVSEERDLVEHVVNRINRSLSDELSVFLRLLRWEQLAPSAGNVQKRINEEIKRYDIFIGIMGDRFGSPTETSESGTQAEFEDAYELWKNNAGVYEIMFYFREIQCCPKNLDEAEQLYKAIKFRTEISEKLHYRKYKEPHDFEQFLRDDLEKTVKRLIKKEKAFQERHPIHTKQKILSTIEKIVRIWDTMPMPSSFIPGDCADVHRFYRAQIQTTDGFIRSNGEDHLIQGNFVTIFKDPVRPFDIQIGDTRSIRHTGNPNAIPDLTNLDLGSVKNMYPFIQVEGYKWIRMVLAELSSDQKILDFIHEKDNDPQVKIIAAKNPSASSELQNKECIFCQADFRLKRTKQSGSKKTLIIANDYPYGPYFHYIAFPSRPVHAWQDLELADIADLNQTILIFLKKKFEAHEWISQPAGVFIGLNSSIKHLVLAVCRSCNRQVN